MLTASGGCGTIWMFRELLAHSHIHSFPKPVVTSHYQTGLSSCEGDCTVWRADRISSDPLQKKLAKH